MDKTTTIKKNNSTEMSVEKGTDNKEIMIPKGRYDCVSLVLKDTRELLKERTQENVLLKQRVVELEEKLDCILSIARWLKSSQGERL